MLIILEERLEMKSYKTTPLQGWIDIDFFSRGIAPGFITKPRWGAIHIRLVGKDQHPKGGTLIIKV
jgi:hypothetical protein